MEFLPVFTSFYNSIADDGRITPTHISIFMALLQEWRIQGCVNPFKIDRVKIMNIGKVSGRFTYNKCMNNLQEFGYIGYTPSKNAFTKSIIYLKGM